ncbi:cellulase family glycosylhydrolase [Pimelobacter simplex]|uniref:cellulase family glycosylhydrolase n=1 Tax=Nocardioides simplex TaxID=2045 RepID=UPI0019321679|nr:cellulase family glycosylhydrolase [Pimelobacter simplex]
MRRLINLGIRRGLASVGCATLVLACLAPSDAVAAEPAPAPDASATVPQDLAHTGRWFTGADGRVVVMHGTNMVNKLAPYTPDALGFGEDDLTFLADNGFNGIRLGFTWAAVEPTPGHYDDVYIDKIVDLADAAVRHGLVPVVNFHQDGYGEKFGGNGAPDWATINYGIPGLAFLPAPANVLPGAAIANENFWRNVKASDGIGLQDHYAAAWKHVAQRFAGDEHTVFELYNEPSPGIVDVALCALPLGCPTFDTQKLAPFHRKVLAAVRQVDADRLVFVEPTAFFGMGARTWHPSMNDPQVGFAFHNYCALGLVPLPLPAELCAPLTELNLSNAQAQFKKTGEPLLMNEFGAFNSDAVVAHLLDRSDEQMLSWMHWAYFAQDFGEEATYGLINDPAGAPEGDNIKDGLLRVLTRPSPRTVSGTPLGWRWDGKSSTFDARYSTLRADGTGRFPAGSTSDFFVHPRFFPGGYTVQVAGGTVTSAPNAAHLTIASSPGATEVVVTVRAAP